MNIKIWISILLIISVIVINTEARTIIDAGKEFEIIDVQTGIYPGNSFIDPSAAIEVLHLSNFSIGKESYIGPFSRISGRHIAIGNYSNIQDDVEIKGVLNISDHVIVAHGAGLSGKVEIGEKSFIGFNTYVQGSNIGKGVYIDHGSMISGVTIPDGKYVPMGSVINGQSLVDNLSDVTDEQKELMENEISINRALAIGYSKLYKEKGKDVFVSVGPNTDGDIKVDSNDIFSRNGSNEPIMENGTFYNTVRIIGEIFIGENGNIGNGTVIRADEGVPIKIGRDAIIGIGDVFHSLNNEEIEIGNGFKLGDFSIVHGPLKIGNNVTIGSRSVVFKSQIGNNVIVGDKVIVANVDIPDGTNIGPSKKIISKEDVENMSRDNTENVERPLNNDQKKDGKEKNMPGFDLIILLGGLSMIYLLQRKLRKY